MSDLEWETLIRLWLDAVRSPSPLVSDAVISMVLDLSKGDVEEGLKTIETMIGDLERFHEAILQHYKVKGN